VTLPCCALCSYESIVRGYHDRVADVLAQHAGEKNPPNDVEVERLRRKHLIARLLCVQFSTRSTLPLPPPGRARKRRWSRSSGRRRWASAAARGSTVRHTACQRGLHDILCSPRLCALQARLAGAEAAVGRYESLAVAIDESATGGAAGVESLRNHARSLARQVVSLEVSTPLITRKYNLLKAELASARTAARSAEVSERASAAASDPPCTAYLPHSLASTPLASVSDRGHVGGGGAALPHPLPRALEGEQRDGEDGAPLHALNQRLIVCHTPLTRCRLPSAHHWQAGAESRLSRLTELAQTWVPGDEHDRATTELAAAQMQLSSLLVSDASLRVQVRSHGWSSAEGCEDKPPPRFPPVSPPQVTELQGLPAALARCKAQLAEVRAEREGVKCVLE
jgi:hypothetical protein